MPRGALTASTGLIVVFFSLSLFRSAELIVAAIISLSRRLGDKNKEIHSGIWNKVSFLLPLGKHYLHACSTDSSFSQSAKGCHEVRGKTLGIIGYGHIGSQLSVMAEALGMRVLFHDIIPKLPLGNSK